MSKDTATQEHPHVTELRKLGACEEAIAWAATQPSRQAAWDNCARADWMLWAHEAIETGLDGQRIRTRIACAIARTVLHLVTPGDERPRLAIEAAEAWADDPTPAGAAARAAAWAAAWAAARAAARDAAWDAAEAAAGHAAWDAAEAAAEAAAWDAAGDAAGAAAGAAARDAHLAASADIVRKFAPTAPQAGTAGEAQ